MYLPQIFTNSLLPLLMVTLSLSTLCLIPRTTVTSLIAPKDTRCKTHPYCINHGVPLWTRETTHKLRARWQASLSGIRADVTVVLGTRHSIHTESKKRIISILASFLSPHCVNLQPFLPILLPCSFFPQVLTFFFYFQIFWNASPIISSMFLFPNFRLS